MYLHNDKTGGEKKYGSVYFFYEHATYKISRLLHKRFLSFKAAKQCYGQIDRRTNGWKAQTNMPPPPQLLRSWGHKDFTSEGLAGIKLAGLLP